MPAFYFGPTPAERYDERHRRRHPGVNRGKGRGITKPPVAKRRHRRK